MSAIRQPQAYLYRIAANVIGEYVMRRRSERITYDSTLAEELAGRPGDSSASTAAEDRALFRSQLFRQVLKELPGTHRAVLVLFAQEGLTPGEIGTRLNINLLTVRKYLRHALARFRAATLDK